jgi:hypothetical protein
VGGAAAAGGAVFVSSQPPSLLPHSHSSSATSHTSEDDVHVAKSGIDAQGKPHEPIMGDSALPDEAFDAHAGQDDADEYEDDMELSEDRVLFEDDEEDDEEDPEDDLGVHIDRRHYNHSGRFREYRKRKRSGSAEEALAMSVPHPAADEESLLEAHSEALASRIPFTHRRRLNNQALVFPGTGVGPLVSAPAPTYRPATTNHQAPATPPLYTMRDDIYTKLIDLSSNHSHMPDAPTLVTLLASSTSARSKPWSEHTMQLAKDLVRVHLAGCSARKINSKSRLDQMRSNLTSTMASISKQVTAFSIQPSIEGELHAMLQDAAVELSRFPKTSN